MMAGKNIRRALWAAVFMFAAFLISLSVPEVSWAAAAHGTVGGFRGWLAGFNVGSGALVLNPAVILIQWANFIIILIVLNKFLYNPLWRVIDERNGKIEDDLASSERDRSETQGYITQYEDSLAEIQQENTEAMVALQQEINEAGREMIDEVREKTSKEIEEARASISTQAKTALSELEGEAEKFATQIANRLAGRTVA